MNITELYTSKNIQTFVENSSLTKEPFLLEAFFPNKKQLGLDSEWLTIQGIKSKTLSPSEFDSNTVKLSREGFEKYQTEMIFFKNSKVIDEKLRQQLNLMASNSNPAVVNQILSNVFNDADSLVHYAAVTREMLRAQALTGNIVIAGNGMAKSIDYGIPTANTIKVNWATPASSDPISDINNARNKMLETTGVSLTKLIMNSVTFNKLQKSADLRARVFGQTSSAIKTVNKSTINEVILGETEVQILIYDKGYVNDVTGKTVKFISDDNAYLVPDQIGYTVMGTTPEESDLLAGSKVADTSIVDTGVAITTIVRPDPVSVETKVSQIVLPSGEHIKEVITFDLSAD